MSIVEVIIAIAAIVITGIIGAYPFFLRTGLATLDTSRASLLGEEGIEIVRMLRDDSWTSNIAALTLNTAYWSEFSASKWKSTTTPQLIDGKFNRTFKLSSVYRDSNDNIASSGTLDPKTRRVDVVVVWKSSNGTSTATTSTFTTDLFSN